MRETVLDRKGPPLLGRLCEEFGVREARCIAWQVLMVKK